MPSPTDILFNLEHIANDAFPVAVAWHVIALAVVAGLLGGWRPPRRAMELLLAAPFISVSVVAWAFHNPFNGVVFAVLALAAVGLAAHAPLQPVTGEYRWSWPPIVGGLLVAIGWTYPHFLEGHPAYAYLYGAPLGILPCPTLLFVLGITLIAGGEGRRAWKVMVALASLFYGYVGVFRLGVWLDVALFAGAIPLGLDAVLPKGKPRKDAPVHFAHSS